MAKKPKNQKPGDRQPNLPEPEGGPFERQREFLEQRFSRLRPKSETSQEYDKDNPFAPSSAGATSPDTAPQPEDGDDTSPARKRLEMLKAYRQRQKPNSPPQSPDNERNVPAPPDPPPSNNWIPIGPSVLRQGQGGVRPSTSGRTVGIAIVPGGNRVYIAAANGGVWRSEDAGETWVSLMDAFDMDPINQGADSLACGAVAVVPGATTATDRIYVGSGEGHGGAYFGVGPIISYDGGTTWNTEPVAPGSPTLAGSTFYALAIDPANNDRVIGATRRGLYRREPDEAGIFHWAQKNLPGAGSNVATSVVATRSGGTTTFYAATRFGPVFLSNDGHTWNQVGAGFPGVGVTRIALAAQPNNPEVVYAFTDEGNVYRLDVNDGNWVQVTGLPDANDLVGRQGWYDLAIAVSPNNVNRIYLGGSTVLSGDDWSGALYRSDLTVSTADGSVSAANTYIGNSVHADIHTIVFAPGDANKLWIGCDGGVFCSTTPAGNGNIFTSLNLGLQTMTMNYLGHHPTEDAVVFCGTQDNGGERFTGEETWLYVSGGDSGFFVVNWNDPYKVLDTYVRGRVRRSTDGGTRYSFSNVTVPLSTEPPAEAVLFYAPLAGTPRNTAPGSEAEADIVAFGSIRPWISTTFGEGWQSIPNGTLAEDSLNDRIRSLAFASATKLYAGTMAGGVYRFDMEGANWTRTQIDTVDGTNILPLAGIVNDIAVDPADASGNSIYITFGGSGDYRHVWHFDGTQWEQRSGPAAGNLNSLLDVQHNALVVDPNNTNHIYVGADIGIWHSTNGGNTWNAFSAGLPDAAVLDLKLHNPRRLLRASTHGRGVFERTLDSGSKQGIELYVRDTQLDQGRFTTINGLDDPANQGQTVRHWRGPDIKLDTPDVNGDYQFPPTGAINFHDFVDTLNDDSRNVATHATATIITRVYVQVHNRGVTPADNVQVMILLANASAGLPQLPAGYEINVQNGFPINNTNWRTLGIVTLNNVRVGFPKIAAVNLDSSMLPPPASLAGNDHHCVLALVHHPSDPYNSTITHTDNNSRQERKAVHKNLKVVQFSGNLPSPPPIVIPIRIHNAYLDDELLTSLILNFNGQRGRIRLYIPDLHLGDRLEEVIKGMIVGQDYNDFKQWAGQHIEDIKRNLHSELPYDKEWSFQRMEDIDLAFRNGKMLEAKDRKQAGLHRIVMAPGTYRTLFLLLDRPPNGKIGESFEIEALQWNDKREEQIGGITMRVELMPEPKNQKYFLQLWKHRLDLRTTIRARLYDDAGELVLPENGAEVHLFNWAANKQVKGMPMKWHRGWKSFYYYPTRFNSFFMQLEVVALINGRKVAEEELSLLPSAAQAKHELSRNV